MNLLPSLGSQFYVHSASPLTQAGSAFVSLGHWIAVVRLIAWHVDAPPSAKLISKGVWSSPRLLLREYSRSVLGTIDITVTSCSCSKLSRSRSRRRWSCCSSYRDPSLRLSLSLWKAHLAGPEDGREHTSLVPKAAAMQRSHCGSGGGHRMCHPQIVLT